MIFWNQVKDSSNETVEALRRVRPEVLRMLGNEGFLKLDNKLANLRFKYNQLKKKYRGLQERLDKQT
ncbi:hypothetical protein AGABI2DRAFT_184919 [Agaricus bisporus var. bisporus H97]|uniref:hypothetical protein n=1 Tax=Agaricus bisporus var. bisporus (strain H97 / ATCC MYA-4626 / FGSC 10389) TaxID=936046 RepID=UPI00029F7D22|nr:hypothetical protein AGABI2DRAFT_184919 [Agaricus bisporus var. bisporus H97]EKV48605.1 hypothetical protein AGABI2DRAFT_184919 [Agaricus bisporus var. bisporus H97]